MLNERQKQVCVYTCAYGAKGYMRCGVDAFSAGGCLQQSSGLMVRACQVAVTAPPYSGASS